MELIVKPFRLIFGTFLAVASIYVTAEVPNTFESGTPAKASEVNENFEALDSVVFATDTTPPQIIVTRLADREVAYYYQIDVSDDVEILKIKPGEPTCCYSANAIGLVADEEAFPATFGAGGGFYLSGGYGQRGTIFPDPLTTSFTFYASQVPSSTKIKKIMVMAWDTSGNAGRTVVEMPLGDSGGF